MDANLLDIQFRFYVGKVLVVTFFLLIGKYFKENP